MLSQFITTSPTPADYFKNIFSNLRQIKELFEERYILDHYLNETDTADTDGHNKLTMKAITVDMFTDKMPYPMNWETGEAELPDNTGILFVKNVSGAERLCFATKNSAGTLTENIIG